MNKKIKIIDLLVKIAKGEEVPKEIKVNGLDFIWKTLDDGAGYFNIEEGHWLEDCISLDSAEDLNTEVEILEDNTEEIEELQEFDIQGLEISGYSMTQAEYLLEDGVNENRDKINEIIRYIKRKDKNND